MDAHHVHRRLLRFESDTRTSADGRRIIRNERMLLKEAIDSGDESRMVQFAKQAHSVLTIYGEPDHII